MDALDFLRLTGRVSQHSSQFTLSLVGHASAAWSIRSRAGDRSGPSSSGVDDQTATRLAAPNRNRFMVTFNRSTTRQDCRFSITRLKHRAGHRPHAMVESSPSSVMALIATQLTTRSNSIASDVG